MAGSIEGTKALIAQTLSCECNERMQLVMSCEL